MFYQYLKNFRNFEGGSLHNCLQLITSPEPSLHTKEKTSDAYLKNSLKFAGGGTQYLDLTKGNGGLPERFWAMVSPSHGGNLTRNTGECPSVARESTLWQILQVDAPAKYSLSARACEGILRRAERRSRRCRRCSGKHWRKPWH